MSVQISITKPINYEKIVSEFAAEGILKIKYKEDDYIEAKDSDDEVLCQSIYDNHDATEMQPLILNLEERVISLEDK
jgi:hypothetical protein